MSNLPAQELREGIDDIMLRLKVDKDGSMVYRNRNAADAILDAVLESLPSIGNDHYDPKLMGRYAALEEVKDLLEAAKSQPSEQSPKKKSNGYWSPWEPSKEKKR